MHLSRISPLPTFEKQWHTEWNGHAIRVENRPRRERLWIDNILTHEHRARLETTATLRSEVLHEGEPHAVRAVIGSIRGRLATGCHIFVDDQLIGGDVGEKLITLGQPQKTVEEQKHEAHVVIRLSALMWLLSLSISFAADDFGFQAFYVTFLSLWNIVIQARRLRDLEHEKTRIE